MNPLHTQEKNGRIQKNSLQLQVVPDEKAYVPVPFIQKFGSHPVRCVRSIGHRKVLAKEYKLIAFTLAASRKNGKPISQDSDGSCNPTIYSLIQMKILMTIIIKEN